MLGIQSLIGSLDVKSSQVFFYTQASAKYDVAKTCIPFKNVKHNVGGGITRSGIFKAPISGTYFFSFNGLNHNNTSEAEVVLNINGVGMSRSIASPNTASYETMALDATLNLTEGDTVEVYLQNGRLADKSYNSFSGFLLEEDLSF